MRLAALLLLGCSLSLQAEEPQRVYLLDGRQLAGRVEGCSIDGELSIASPPGRRSAALLEQVAQILLRAHPPEAKQPAPHLLLLQDGTRLTGELVALDASRLRFRWSAGARELDLPRSAVRAVGLEQARWLDLARGSETSLELRDPAQPRIACRELRLEGQTLLADGRRVPLQQARALRLPAARAAGRPGEGWYARVILDRDQLAIGLLEQMDRERLTLVTAHLGRLVLPRALLWKIVFGPPPDPTNLGYTLVAESHAGQVVLLDPAGRELWAVRGLSKPHDVEPLPDGSLLVVEYQAGRCRKLTRQGRELWKVAGLKNPIDADLLPGGNVLVTEFGGGRLVEFDGEGKAVWQWTGLKYPNEAEPLAGDRVLITESGKHRVLIAERKTRKVLWQYDKLKWPMDADLLPGGNVLITDNNAHRVLEVDRGGRVVWFYDCRNPYEADKLANGNYLIVETGRQRLIEVTPDKRIVWQAERGKGYPVAATRY